MDIQSDRPSAEGDVATLFRDGIVGLKGAFSRDFAEAMREDMMTAFWKAIQRPGGTVGRGPRRWYVEIHPEEFSGFVELTTHPWVVAMCEGVLGPDYRIVEIGFDTPFQGAKNQPWHRDFPSPADTYEGRRITSLAAQAKRLVRRTHARYSRGGKHGGVRRYCAHRSCARATCPSVVCKRSMIGAAFALAAGFTPE